MNLVRDPKEKAEERRLAHSFIGWGGLAAALGAIQWGIGATFLVAGLLCFVLGLAYLLQQDT